MTTEIEKTFFNAFEIEPIGCNDNENCTGTLDCTQCPNAEYPQITDRHYLSLIVILNNQFNITEGGYPIMLLGLTIEALREHILKRCIHHADSNFVKGLVQAIFKGER